jgi:hypothetical protein
MASTGSKELQTVKDRHDLIGCVKVRQLGGRVDFGIGNHAFPHRQHSRNVLQIDCSEKNQRFSLAQLQSPE